MQRDAEINAYCRQFVEESGGNRTFAALENLMEDAAVASSDERVEFLHQSAELYIDMVTPFRMIAQSGKHGGRKKKKKKKKKAAKSLRHLRLLLTKSRAELAGLLIFKQIEDDVVPAHLLLLEVDPSAHVLSLEDFRFGGPLTRQTLARSVLRKWIESKRIWTTSNQMSDMATPIEGVIEQLTQHISRNAASPPQLTRRQQQEDESPTWSPSLDDPVLAVPGGYNIQAAWQDYLAVEHLYPGRASRQMAIGMANALVAFVDERPMTEEEIPDVRLRALTNKYFVDAMGQWSAVKKKYAVPWSILLSSRQRVVPFELGRKRASAFLATRERLETELIRGVMASTVEHLFSPKQNHQQTTKSEQALAFPRQCAFLLCSSILVEQSLGLE